MRTILTQYRKTAMILASILVLSACNQGQSVPDPTDTDNISPVTEMEQVSQEDVYPYELQDYGGYEFTFLNMQDDFWTGAHQIIDYDETQSSIVESAIYERNRAAEDQLNIQIGVEKVTDLGQLSTTLHKSVMAQIKVDCEVECTFKNGLDVGCGAGLSTKALKLICDNVTGTDISEAMIGVCEELYKEAGYSFYVAAAEETKIPKVKYDIVTAAGVINWVEREKFLGNMQAVTGKGGLLVIYDFWITDKMLGKWTQCTS